MPAAAQVWDNTGNSQLNGNYYFREVVYAVGDDVGDISDGLAIYGSITFNGRGAYSISSVVSGNQTVPQAILYDAGAGELSAFTASGTYTIGAAGYGFINWTLSAYGVSYQIKVLVSNGLILGSSTDNSAGVNEMFVAAPIAATALTNSALNGSYSLAYMNLPLMEASDDGSIGDAYDSLVQFSANGAGSIGTASVKGYIGTNGSSPFTMNESGVKFSFSGGAAVVTFPTGNNIAVQGQEYLYFSPDQNFVFGGSPQNIDMIVGVRTGSAPNFGATQLYYQAGLDVDESTASSGYASLDSYFGSFDALSSGAIVGHQRIFSPLMSSTAFDYTLADSFSFSNAYTDSGTSFQYIVGNGGVRIGIGIGPYLGINVAVPGPSLTASSSVYLSPVGVVNAASSAPFTAAIAPGELITLYGSGLAARTVVASTLPFPTTLGGVQVFINNVAAPIYVVSSGQVSVIVPSAITAATAQIQVVNGSGTSNAVTMFVDQTAPGVFTNPVGGLGYAAALHANYSLIGPNSPAAIGETISVFVTGLGTVFPSVADGSAGPSSPLSTTTNTIQAYVDGVEATVSYAGLAPGFAGLYQINLTIPSGVSSGDVALDVSGPDSYTSEAAISIQ